MHVEDRNRSKKFPNLYTTHVRMYICNTYVSMYCSPMQNVINLHVRRKGSRGSDEKGWRAPW